MYRDLVSKWLSSNNIEDEYKKEIYDLDEKELEDRFYKELEFGTGGLRGVIGSGTNRMNIYTVGKVTQGYADFLNEKFKNENISVAIAYDSRIKSDEFAKRAALIFAANGIKVYLYESLRPTPMLSFALRELKCKGGVVLTASHNPKEYNGYKVYGEDGCQLTDELSKKVYEYILNVNMFDNIKIINEDEAIKNNKLEYIGEDIDKIYIEKVKNLVIRKDLVENYSKDLNIIYTPLHGAGFVPVTRVLKEEGYSNLKVVKEQQEPDGNFTTVPYPNPELHEVFDLGIKLAKEKDSDIIFATDPDCDRVGVAIKTNNGNYELLNGNQMGILLSYYILTSLKEKGELSNKGVIVKTIVSTDVVKYICDDFKIETLDVLTGFKYIGEKIREFENTQLKEYIFGFEESYGYLMGTFVRDKDAVIAVNIIAEMTLYYKKLGKTLKCVLNDIYDKYGVYTEELISIDLKGKEGQDKIVRCLETLRSIENIEIEGKTIFKIQDYKLRTDKNFKSKEILPIDLPVSNVMKMIFDDGSWFAVRPSGTEPKMKVYLSVKSNDRNSIDECMSKFKKNILELIKKCMN